MQMDIQSTASLLSSVDVPEAILRLLLQETEIERLLEAPVGYDPESQGEWDSELTTFGFQRPIQLIKVEREQNYLYLEYKFGELGYWSFEIEPEKVTIERL
jgi:hypothetical protein